MQIQASTHQVPLIVDDLPETRTLRQLLIRRQSHRTFKKQPLDLKQISQLLWAAQGILPDRRRTAPSAGALFPFKIFISLALPPADVEQGLYLFKPQSMRIEMVFRGNFQKKLFQEALFQECILLAPACLILTARFPTVQAVYGARAIPYIFLEGGHIGQNIYLMATALNLGTVAVGAFHEDGVRQILMLGDDEIPVYLFPVGYPAE